MPVLLCSNMLEELLDDQEDIGDINLSSRPMREEGRRQRDREALEREVGRPLACCKACSDAIKAGTAALLAARHGQGRAAWAL